MSVEYKPIEYANQAMDEIEKCGASLGDSPEWMSTRVDLVRALQYMHAAIKKIESKGNK